MYIHVVGNRLQSMEQERNDLLRSYLPMIRAEVEAELGPFRTRIDNARAALSEANAALSRQSEIDGLVTSWIEAFVVEQTREHQAAYDAARLAAVRAQHDCIARFRLRLAQGCYDVWIDDFAPANHHELRQQLAEAKEQHWWDHVSTHPIGSVVKQLDHVPSQYIDTVLHLILSLPLTSPHILRDKVFNFLSREHSRLSR